MSAIGKKLRRAVGLQGRHIRLMHWCPACEEVHGFTIAGGPPCWSFNGNFDKPSFNPSMLIYTEFDDEGMPLPLHHRRTICHYFIRTGAELGQRGANLDPNKSYIDYCSDSPHALRGKIVELPDWPYAPGEFGGIEDAGQE